MCPVSYVQLFAQSEVWGLSHSSKLYCGYIHMCMTVHNVCVTRLTELYNMQYSCCRIVPQS